MPASLDSRFQRSAFALSLIFALAIYVWLVSKRFMASYYGDQPNFSSQQRAAHLDPGNAEYQYRLGLNSLLAFQSPQEALPFLKSAVALNPHRSDYWFGLANGNQLVGNRSGQEVAMERAIRDDPSTPDVAWEAANLYLANGETDKALMEFRVLMANDPSRVPDALNLIWQTKPDLDSLLGHSLLQNPEVYMALVEYFASRNENDLAFRVWSAAAALGEPIEQGRVLDYVRYLLSNNRVAQAKTVWRDAALLSNLQNYQPESNNLIVNGDFNWPVLNSGFGWRLSEQAGVAMALDTSHIHSGNHSLAISYDSTGIEDTGISQWVAVDPNTSYHFSAFYLAPDMQGAGGPQFVIEDLTTGLAVAATDDLKDAQDWKSVATDFTTGLLTDLVRIRIRRHPVGNAIRGKLWISEVRIAPKAAL